MKRLVKAQGWAMITLKTCVHLRWGIVENAIHTNFQAENTEVKFIVLRHITSKEISVHQSYETKHYVRKKYHI